MRDFASDKAKSGQQPIHQRLFAEFSSLSNDLKTRLAVVVSILTGLQSSTVVIPEVSNSGGDQVVTRHELRQRYPLHLRGPLNPKKLEEMLGRAHQEGVEVLLIAPPLPQAVADYIGVVDMARFERHLHDTAELLGLPLLYNGEVWPNTLFVDVAHLNRTGRSRFMSELAGAWKARHDN